MDYWEPARANLKNVLAELEKHKGLDTSVHAFIEHALHFGASQPIPDYPQWSNELGNRRDDVLADGGDSLVAKIAHLFTELIWQWEYGAMGIDGYAKSVELSDLAKKLEGN